MAIYDVDAINEQELAAERDDILDNMLEACDQMLSVLDEHGGARNKYVDIMRSKSWNNTMKGIHANGYDYPENELAKQYFDLSEKQRAEANKYRNEGLSKYVLMEKFLDKWNGVMPRVITGDSNLSTMITLDNDK